MKKLINYLLWLVAAINAYSCGTSDYETMIGGYPTAHDVTTVNFAVDPRTSNMVVAGRMTKGASLSVTEMGYIYYIDNSLCKIRWMIEDNESTGGADEILFSSNNRHLIYIIGRRTIGVAENTAATF